MKSMSAISQKLVTTTVFRKTCYLLTMMCFLFLAHAKAQVSTYYVFSKSDQTYKSDTSTTSVVPASIFATGWDDNGYTGYKFPFNFTYNGTLYTAGVGTVGVDSDGWIAFSTGAMTIGAAATGAGGSWISASDHTGVYLKGTANDNGFCGFNSDIEDQTWTAVTGNTTSGSTTVTNVSDFSNLRIGTRLTGSGITDGTVINRINTATSTFYMSAPATTTGTAVSLTPRTSIYAFVRGIAPYRQFVIQWTRMTRYSGAGTGDDFSFQLVLNEGGGLVNYQTLQTVYGVCKATNTVAQNAQVGLRGASAADFNARTTTTNWSATTAAAANTATCSLTPSVFPNSGLTYTWSPACLAVAGNAGAISGTNPVCPGTIVDYSIPGVPGAIYYTWTYTGTNTTYSTTTTLPLNTLDFSFTATGGTLTVTPGNLCGNGSPSSIVINMNGLPTASIAYGASSYCTSASPATPTITGTSGGTFSALPSGLTINSTTGQVTPSTSTPGSYVITYTFVSGCTAKTTTNLTINAGPAVTATATPSLVCTSPNSSQLQASVPVLGYSISSIPFASLTPSAGSTTLWNTYQLDNISTSIAMPFTFNYFGSSITNFFVSTEGYVQLQTGTAVQWTPQVLPDAANPNNIIALAWADLIVDPSTNPGSSVRYFVNGTTPNRVLVVDYINLRFLGGGGSQNVTGQIRLYESDSHIEVAAGTVSDNGSVWTKTMGIENSTGTVALTPPGRNHTVWNTTNEAWSFIPTTGTYSYVWSPGTSLSSTTIANPVVTNLASTTNYTVTVTNTVTGCTGTASASVTVGSPLSGTYTVGVAGNYPTLTAAVSAYNSLCIGGPITFSLIDATYPSETYPITINSNVYASSVNTLTIKPAVGISPTITGSSAVALIKLNAADYVTIDGSNVVNGTTRNLTFVNTSTNATTSTIIWLGSAAGNGATNNNIKNCNFTGNAPTTTFTSVISSSGTTVGGIAEAANNNNTYINNKFIRAQTAIATVGPTGNETGTIITGNTIGSATAGDKMGWSGIEIYQQTNSKVMNNTIFGITTSSSLIIPSGISVYGTQNNDTISGNRISDVKHTNSLGYGANGIYLGTSSTAAGIVVYNNFIYDIAGYGSNAFNYYDNGYGMVLDQGGGYKIYFNTIVMSGEATFTGNHRSAAVLISAGVTTAASVDMRNNIFDNRQIVGGANSRYSMLCIAGNAVFSTLNYNGYFNPGGSTNLLCRGTNATTYTTLAQVQTSLGGNANSVGTNVAASCPTYVNNVTDVHLQSIAANSVVTNLGTPITGITVDYDTTTRNGLTPDIGADEWLMPNTGSWVGKTSIDWLTNTNWETNKIPDRSTDVTITGGYNFMPTVVTTQNIRGLNLSAPVPANTPVLTLSGGQLNIYGNITRTGGSIDGINGTIETDSSITRAFPSGLFLNNALKNLIINNGAGLTLNGLLDIYQSVKFGSVGTLLTTNSNLTFKSTATETAWLGNLTGKTVTGTATVERYIATGLNHSKTWQLLALPVKGTTSIKASWMENNAPGGNLKPGYGTTFSSEVAGAVGRGWDFYTPISGNAGGPSIKTYVPGTNKWQGIDNGVALTSATQLPSSGTVNPARVYFTFVRGDRSVVTSGGLAVPTVLRCSGTLYTVGAGNTPPTPSVGANQFACIANPYASAIDFSALVRTGGVDNKFYVWDPLLPGTLHLGGYQTISALTGWLPTPGGTANYPSATPVKTIQSGQGFLVYATGTAGTLPFTEAAKIDGSRLITREQDMPRMVKSLSLSLYNPAEPQYGPADGNVVVFNHDYSNEIDGDDAIKMSNSAENAGISSHDSILAIEARKMVHRNDTIFYDMKNLRIQAYQLRFGPRNLSAVGLEAFLVDRFLNTQTSVSLLDSTFIDFNVTTDAGSYAANRFYLIFNKLRLVPISITHVDANRKEKNILVNWKVENETDIEHYEVERSADGRNFSKMQTKLPESNEGATVDYTSNDDSPLPGNNYYRIKAANRSGETQYSAVVKVAAVKALASISVYPNPVTDKSMAVSFVNQETGIYQVNLINEIGQVVMNKAIQVNGSNVTESITLGKELAAGKYQLQVIAENGKKTIQQLLIK